MIAGMGLEGKGRLFRRYVQRYRHDWVPPRVTDRVANRPVTLTVFDTSSLRHSIDELDLMLSKLIAYRHALRELLRFQTGHRRSGIASWSLNQISIVRRSWFAS